MPFTTQHSITLRRALTPRVSISTRAFTNTARRFADPPDQYHNPPSSQGAGRGTNESSSHVSADKQSSASQHEHKTGDDHPAKQADPQPSGDRSTATDTTPSVKEGTEGRIDKQSQKVKEMDVGGTNS